MPLKSKRGSGVPEIESGDSGKVLAVKSDESGTEWVTAPSGDMLKIDYDSDADGKVNAADVADAATYATTAGRATAADSADSVAWEDVSSKPSDFTPSAHALDAHTAVTLAELNAKISDKDIASTDAATTSAAGLMSASDKTKLDGVPVPVEGDAGKLVAVKGDESGYENVSPYTLPTASADTLGGVKVGSRLTITDGVLSADEQGGGGGVSLAMAIALGGD